MPLELQSLLSRLAIDLACVLLLVRGIHYRRDGRSDQFLTFCSVNLVVFMITALLRDVQLGLGSTFGLFAVFSMLRFRTENLTSRDMTYLLVLIALGLVCAAATTSLWTVTAIGAATVAVVWLLESALFVPRERAQPILYENVQLVHAAEREALLADLRTRTGLRVHRVEVDEVDFVKDCARLTVYYLE